MNRLLLFAVFILLPLISTAQQYDTLYISTLHTTHIIFENELTYVDISNKVIAAKVVENSRQVLAIKARESFDFTTTLSALESSGRIHTFIVSFLEKPECLVMDKRQTGIMTETDRKVTATAGRSGAIAHKKRLHHISDKKYGIEISCDDIFIDSDITGIIITLDNRSGVSYSSGGAVFVQENRRKSKRKPLLEKSLFPLESSGTFSAGPGEKSSAIYYFEKMSLTKDNVLKVYVYESGGVRHYTLTIGHRDINKAKVR